MKSLQKILLIICLLGCLGALSSCGRYSAPSPIEGSGYPHNYPHN
ncbi:MAG: hypothetical protein ACI4OE_04635 [Alphaproteobacteria bacterium]|nr:hypothetical protein [Alphaproteobacteria bacterium]